MTISAEQAAALLRAATPGPYRARGYREIWRADGSTLATIVPWTGDREAHCDATLLAAAPDLAASLIEAHAEIERLATVVRFVRDANDTLRDRFGGRAHETMGAFVERLVAERDAEIARLRDAADDARARGILEARMPSLERTADASKVAELLLRAAERDAEIARLRECVVAWKRREDHARSEATEAEIAEAVTDERERIAAQLEARAVREDTSAYRAEGVSCFADGYRRGAEVLREAAAALREDPTT